MDAYSHRVKVGRRFGSRIATGDAVFLTGTAGIVGLPCTVSDGIRRPLSGINRFMLLQVMKDQGWADPRFFTTAQAEQAGWTIAPEAKQIGLQFLVSAGDDGLPLETPQAKQFHVFNASDIAGVPEAADVALVPVKYLEEAVTQAGFSVEMLGLRTAVSEWLSSLQAARFATDISGATLRSKLAAALLEVQVGLPGERSQISEFASDWAQAIDRDPLSFFQVVKDAEELVAIVMGQVNAVSVEMQVVEELASTRETAEKAMKVGIANKAAASPRIEAMFQERAAILAVPFSDKDRAKEKGAVWYGPQSLWFVPKGINVDRFKEWDPRTHVLGTLATEEILINNFKEAMAELGLDTSGPIVADGKWHNVSVDSKPGKNKSGAYILSLDGGRNGEATGMVNDKFTGASRPWRYDGALLTPEQKARMRSAALAREAEATLEVEKTQGAAAAHAAEIWAAGSAADTHGYIVKKGIAAEGMRQVAGSVLLQYPEYVSEDGLSIIRASASYLIVPMKDAEGQLRAVQAISEDGTVKSFMRGAQKKGTMFVLGAETFSSLCALPHVTTVAYAEGVATGASFRRGTSIPVIVCFDAGNLEMVAAQTASKLPVEVVPLMAVDNDQYHVERAIGFLSARVGTNPHAVSGEVVRVASGPKATRSVDLGDAIADGQWHQGPSGKYCIALQREGDSGVVRSVVVDVVPDNGGRKISSSFSNRGLDAGNKAKQAFLAANGVSRAVMVIPEFRSTAGRPSDWNDLEKIEGVAAIRSIVHSAIGSGISRSHDTSTKAFDVASSRKPALAR